MNPNANTQYEIYGSNTSPYSCKLRAVLRYRRLTHVWRIRRPNMGAEIEAVRPKLMPILRFPDTGDYRVDSTPLIHELEQRHQERSVLPPHPADQFLCHLIEDFADEWGSKMMYYHRWIEEATGHFGAAWIIHEWMPELSGADRERAEEQIYIRQRSRMELVIGDQDNGSIIEADFRALLKILGPYVSGTRFLFGSRPSLADFALYGQLSPMIVDPLPQRIIREQAPAVEQWVIMLDDCSGTEGEWDLQLPGSARARHSLLSLIGSSYLPFLMENAKALEANSERMEVKIRGQNFARAPFVYQGKCYASLLAHWLRMEEEERNQLRPLLAETGCLPFLEKK